MSETTVIEPASEDRMEEEEEEEEEVDEEEEEDDDGGEEEGEITLGRCTGRGLTLKTLLKENILEPGEGYMSINYLGNKFKGDLLQDGRIRSQETNNIFGTPSAWAIYCKKIVNPDKKSGCGWASVRYRGKKLDSYKNNWFRQKRLEYEREENEPASESEEEPPHEQEIVQYESLGNRNPATQDQNTMVELSSFQSLGRMQPFNVAMSSSALAVAIVHGHLTSSEVVGYLAGQWDVSNHNLIISHALPLRCRVSDVDNGHKEEQNLFAAMDKLNLSLIGWYHTHPFTPPLPTLRDVDSQLEYEMKMKGSNDASYTPCIGIIYSPYCKESVKESTINGFWVIPPLENKPLDYGRPMNMAFNVVQDSFIPKEALLHMRETIMFYEGAADFVNFTDVFDGKMTNWDKLKIIIKEHVPKDHFLPMMEYVANLLQITDDFKEHVETLKIADAHNLELGKASKVVEGKESVIERKILENVEKAKNKSMINECEVTPILASEGESAKLVEDSRITAPMQDVKDPAQLLAEYLAAASRCHTMTPSEPADLSSVVHRLSQLDSTMTPFPTSCNPFTTPASQGSSHQSSSSDRKILLPDLTAESLARFLSPHFPTQEPPVKEVPASPPKVAVSLVSPAVESRRPASENIPFQPWSLVSTPSVEGHSHSEDDVAPSQ